MGNALSSFYADVTSDFIKLDGDCYYRVPENKAPITVATSQVVTGDWSSCYVCQLDPGTAGNNVTGFTGYVSAANGFYAPDGNVFNKRATFSNSLGWYQYWDGCHWLLSNTPYTTAAPAQWTQNGSGDIPGPFGNIETYLTANVIAGQSTLYVQSYAGFYPGDTIYINPDNIGVNTQESGVISSIGSIILESPVLSSHLVNEVVRKTVATSSLFQGQSSTVAPVIGFDIGLGMNAFGAPVTGANGNFVPTGDMINGRNTFTNNNGWYMFWDGVKWVLSNTPYNVDSTAVVTGFTGAVSGANGSYKPQNTKQNDKLVYKNNGWLIYWDTALGKWVLTDTAYTTTAPAKWIADGTGDEPGAFDYSNGGSAEFLGQ